MVHEPQCMSSALVSRQLAPHAVKPVSQLAPHAVPSHVAVPWVGVRQGVQLVPQVLTASFDTHPVSHM